MKPVPVESRRDFLRCAGAALSLIALGGRTFAAAECRYPIPQTDGVTIDRTNQVILVRFQNFAYAFNLACPHENTALKWLPKDGRFQCPRHESKYQPNGTFMSGRATRNMDRLAIRRDGSDLVVNLDTMWQSDRDAAAWAAATVSLGS